MDKSKSKGKGKDKLNSVENSNWEEGWLEAGTSNREQGEEQAEGWWNEARWWTANDQTPW